MLEQILTDHLAMLKNQTTATVSDNGYSHCGLEDMLAESIEADIIKYTKLLDYVNGTYTPADLKELEYINLDIQEATTSFIQSAIETLRHEANMAYAIADEKLEHCYF